MKTDLQLQHDVTDELEWHPSVDASHIGVTAREGVVTLTGYTARYAEKAEAERLVKSLTGVRAVANDIEVRLPGGGERNDTELATAALNALKWNSAVPADKVKVTVKEGWVTLEGQVEWQFERQAARDVVSSLTGVRGILNNLSIKAKPQSPDIKKKIEEAFKRKAEIDASHVRVVTTAGTVKLEGCVSTWSEYNDAEAVAWAAPGVVHVDNSLSVGIS